MNDRVISPMRLLPVSIVIALSLCCNIVDAEEIHLPGTTLLVDEGDLSEKMVSAWHRELDRRLLDSVEKRASFWRHDISSRENYARSISPNRERLRTILGVVDARVAPRMEYLSDDRETALIAQTDLIQIWQVRWPVLDGVHGEGLLLQPKQQPKACIVALGDADHLPEQLAGLSSASSESVRPWARWLAENGCVVIVPLLVDRQCEFSGVPEIAMTNEPHREWIYRQAFEMGRHVIGYEIQKTLAAVDWYQKKYGADVPVGVAGYGEGGLIAFCSAAVDHRIDLCLVSGYFGPRELLWKEPVYRNVWGLLKEFGDAELATLIAPRRLYIEYRTVPAVVGPPSAEPPVRLVAASGRLETPSIDAVSAEHARILTALKNGSGTTTDLDPLWTDWTKLLIPEDGADGNADAKEQSPAANSLAAWLKPTITNWRPASSDEPLIDARNVESFSGRKRRGIEELEQHVQHLISKSDKVRNQFMLDRCDRASVEKFSQDSAGFRNHFHDEVIGKLEGPAVEPRPRSRLFAETDRWKAYEVVLDFWSETFCWGILVVPNDLQPGEKRPVVVCQHGLEGVPSDTLTTTGPGFQPYRAFAARLAERGFVTFAPHNPYRGKENFMLLQRKLNPLKASLGSIIVAQHTQILNWLESLPFVDGERIGFYGLSYGGWSASRIPAILERYKLSICSACFNDWIRKTASTEYIFCYPFHTQYEMPEWNLGHTFNNAEMAYLMIPRAFMVERGHHDGVSIDSWVAGEYAKVRWLYTQLGLQDITEIEYFNGGHIINGERTFEFLHEQLDFPMKDSK
ncbi:MAG: dienelactone hydrolase family protein [Planctomycetaceae bacterium]